MEENIFDCSNFHSEFSSLIKSISANPYTDSNLFLRQAATSSANLPLYIRESFSNFLLQGNETGTILLTSCPQEPNIDSINTPQGMSNKKSFISESCLAMIGAQLGNVFGYMQIEEGILFHNIIPKPGMEDKQSYAGSLIELQLHTEQHFHPYSSDYLLLYCLRSVPNAMTSLSSIRQVLPELDKHYIDILFEPQYKTGIDHVFGNSNTEKGNGPIKPVLYGNYDDPFLRYDQDLMIGITPEAQNALEALQVALEKVQQMLCLNPGDLLIIDNKRVVHGRTTFTPKFDGKDRWLQRAKVIRDLSGIGSDCDLDKHIVKTQFVL